MRTPVGPRGLLVFVIPILWLSACGDDDATPHQPPEPARARIRVEAGQYQVGYPGEVLAPLEVRVEGSDGLPLETGVTFTLRTPPPPRFGMTGGEATLSETTATTDPAGLARTTPTLGTATGHIAVEVRAPESSAWPVTLHLWSYPHPAPGKRPLCLLAFNDFHTHFEPWQSPSRPSGGLARLATLLMELRRANAARGIPTLVFNQGDDFENTWFQDVPGAIESLLLTWDRVGVDLWQTGNHDFHFGLPYLADKILNVANDFAPHEKGHPMLLTWGNVDPSTLRTDLLGYADLFETGFEDRLDERLFQQTTVLDASGLRVGVVGVVTDAAVYTQVVGDPAFFRTLDARSPDAQGMTFFGPDPRDSTYINEALDDVDDQGVDLVVVTSHAGLGFGDRVNIPPGADEHIAREGLGSTSGRPVDVVLSGHSHVRLNHAIFVDNPAGGRTGIVQALEGGALLARVDLVVDATDHSVTWVDSGLVAVDESIPEDPGTAAEVATLAATLDSHIADRRVPVAYTDTFLGSAERTVSPMGNLITAAFAASLRPQEGSRDVFIPMAVPSTYRTDIHPGPIDRELIYQVLSMHKMDAVGTNDDTLAYLTFRPGLFDMSFFWLGGTEKTGITAAEYAIELVHSVGDVLENVMPAGGNALRLEVLQLGRVSYLLDATAPPFERVVPGSVRVDGKRPDPNTTYRLLAAHSIISTLGRVLDGFIVAEHTDGGGDVDSVLIEDPDTGEPFTDTEIPLWESLEDFLQTEVGLGGWLPKRLRVVDGSGQRTLQPDLTLWSPDITIEPLEPYPGDDLTVTVTVRNLGEIAVPSARVGLYLETTPWDPTDDPDGFPLHEGLPADYPYSRELLAEETTGVGAWPDTARVTFRFTLPADLPPGPHLLEVRIGDVQCDEVDPHTGRPYVEASAHNNQGRGRARQFLVY